MSVKGFHGDLNATYPVGNVDQESLDLMSATKRSMEEAIAICKPGVPYREIGNKIEEVIKPEGYSIVRRYTGHGIHSLVSTLDSCGSRQMTLSFSFTACPTSCITGDRKHLGRWRRGKYLQ